LLAFAVYSITFLILSFRWRRILRALGEDLPFLVAYQAFAGGVLLSDMTPGKIGDLSRPLLVKDRLALNKGIVSVVIDRYTDLLTSFSLGLVGMLFITRAGPYHLLGLAAILMIIASTSLIWFRRSLVVSLLRGRFPIFMGITYSFEDAISHVRGVRGLVAGSVLITILAWITHALRIMIIARSIGFDLPLPVLVLALPLVSALSLVPVTISGLGLVEGGLAALLAVIGLPAVAGISIALMDRAITVIFHILIGGRAVSGQF
jgi:uncharacterized membrane protein YbhN (UPF0104 family)